MQRVTFTQFFEQWVKKLKDRRARSIIQHTIDMMIEGSLTNTKNVGGGNKSTQQADIETAKKIKKGLK